MIGNGFARRKDILQDAVPLRLFAVHRLHLILVGTDFRYSALNVSRLGVPSPYQLGVPHRSGDTGRLLHALTHRMTTRHGRILPNGDDSCTTHVVCCPRPSHNLAVSVCELRSHYCVTVLGYSFAIGEEVFPLCRAEAGECVLLFSVSLLAEPVTNSSSTSSKQATAINDDKSSSSSWKQFFSFSAPKISTIIC